MKNLPLVNVKLLNAMLLLLALHDVQTPIVQLSIMHDVGIAAAIVCGDILAILQFMKYEFLLNPVHLLVIIQPSTTSFIHDIDEKFICPARH
jgi:hypothetical protein